MRLPFVMRAPVTRGDDDRELVQLRRNRASKADRCAEALDDVADLGTAQENVERSTQRTRFGGGRILHRAARTGFDRVVERALIGGEIFDGDLFKPLTLRGGIVHACSPSGIANRGGYFSTPIACRNSTPPAMLLERITLALFILEHAFQEGI